MHTLTELILTVQRLDDRNRQDDLNALTDAWDMFQSYFNAAVDMEHFSISTVTWNRTAEYLYKNMDKKRSLLHDACIEKCGIINRIAEETGFDLYIDTSDRKQVARFVGDSLMTAYNRGTACGIGIPDHKHEGDSWDREMMS